jgi:hypothetical protein
VAAWYQLDPEVPIALGDDCAVIRRPDGQPEVVRLHVEFQPMWLGDDLMTTHPVYLVTRRLAMALRSSALSGFDLNPEVQVSVDDNIGALLPDWRPPAVEWLRVSGVPKVHDVGLTTHFRLIVSSAALRVIQAHQLDHCDIHELG